MLGRLVAVTRTRPRSNLWPSLVGRNGFACRNFRVQPFLRTNLQSPADLRESVDSQHLTEQKKTVEQLKLNKQQRSFLAKDKDELRLQDYHPWTDFENEARKNPRMPASEGKHEATWKQWLRNVQVPPPEKKARNWGTKMKALPPRPLWLIKEEEIEEKFLAGGRGAGGQKINKSSTKVQLKHKPTGIVVTCQYSRLQFKNRRRAREILAEQLEEIEDPKNCRLAAARERKLKRKLNASKKRAKKMKKIEAMRDGINKKLDDSVVDDDSIAREELEDENLVDPVKFADPVKKPTKDEMEEEQLHAQLLEELQYEKNRGD